MTDETASTLGSSFVDVGVGRQHPAAHGLPSRDFWFQQFRAYIIGYTYVTAKSEVHLLPFVERLEIYAMPGGAADPTLPEIRTNGASWPYIRRVALRGPEAERIASSWRRIRSDVGGGALCHDPAYCLRFYGQDKLLLETSVCWHCHNFTLSIPPFGHVEYGFDPDSESAQTLLARLRTVAPVPDSHQATGP